MPSVPVNYYNRNDVERSYAVGKVIGFLDACANLQDHPMYYPDFIDSLEIYIKEAFGDEVVDEFLADELLTKFPRKYHLPYRLEVITNPSEPNDQVWVRKLDMPDDAISRMSGIEPMLVRVKWCKEDTREQIEHEMSRMYNHGEFNADICNRLISRITKLYNIGHRPAICLHEDEHYHVLSLEDVNRILSIVICPYRLRQDRKNPHRYHVAKI